MTEPRWLSADEQRMWRAFTHMDIALNAAIDRQLSRDHGLSAAEYAVLVPLSEATDHTIRPRDLVAILQWDRSRLSHLLRRMETRGLIRRETCDTDARGTVIQLTQAGRDAIEAAAPGHVETVRKYFVDVLTPAERAALESAAGKVLDAITSDAQASCVENDCAD